MSDDELGGSLRFSMQSYLSGTQESVKRAVPGSQATTAKRAILSKSVSANPWAELREMVGKGQLRQSVYDKMAELSPPNSQSQEEESFLRLFGKIIKSADQHAFTYMRIRKRLVAELQRNLTAFEKNLLHELMRQHM